MSRYYLAVDIGASSGRHIVGRMTEAGLQTREVFRFPNGMVSKEDHLTWDVEALEGYVREGVERALAEFGTLESMAVDTWGVDYVLMRGEDPVLPVYAYRDGRTQAVIPRVHERVPFEELYGATGCQFQPFNSVYQLAADASAGRLEGVTDWLMIPEYLTYRLCGAKAREYTNATTSGLVNALTGEFDHGLTDRLGLPGSLFPGLVQPGTVVGEYRGVKVVLCATHDTASAVEGIPLEQDSLYLSSGTWSLLGAKVARPLTDDTSRLANFTNEGGVGYIRYQKNIMGMWPVNELRRELCPDAPFDALVEAAEASDFDGTVDINAQEFLAPRSMRAAFDRALSNTGLSEPARRGDIHRADALAAGDYFRCAFASLALAYRQAVQEIEDATSRRYGSLYVVGGGAKNGLLNRMIRQQTGKHVVALPIEATALGNIMVQLKADRAR